MRFPLDVYLFALLGAAVATAAAMPSWRAWCQRTGTMDDPGHRKIHSTPIALAGGNAVTTGLIIPVLIAGLAALLFRDRAFESLAFQSFQYGFAQRWPQIAGICAGALGMLLLGIRDDRYELSPAVKFGGQLAIALIVAACGVRITLFVPNILFSYAITALWILTVVNAFNFIDNMNGLCAGVGCIASLCFALVAALSGQYLVATTAFLVAGALLGFLPFNFPKATVFLGDAGSHLVGFLLAVLAILPHFHTPQNPHTWAVLKPLLILAVPLCDLVGVVLYRWKTGKPVYIGDNNHFSHRLVRHGWSKPSAVLLLWAATAITGLFALW